MSMWINAHLFMAIQWGAQIPSIKIQNPFKIQTFWCSDWGWLGIRMIGTIATAVAIDPTIQKWNQNLEIQDGSYLVRFGMVGLFGFGMSFQFRTISEQLLTIQNPNVFGIRAPLNSNSWVNPFTNRFSRVIRFQTNCDPNTEQSIAIKHRKTGNLVVPHSDAKDIWIPVRYSGQNKLVSWSSIGRIYYKCLGALR